MFQMKTNIIISESLNNRYHLEYILGYQRCWLANKHFYVLSNSCLKYCKTVKRDTRLITFINAIYYIQQC